MMRDGHRFRRTVGLGFAVLALMLAAAAFAHLKALKTSPETVQP